MISNSAIKDFLKSVIPKLTVRFLLIVGVFLLSFFLFTYIVHEVVQEKEAIWDNTIAHWLDAYTSPAVISFMKVLTFFGSANFLTPAYILLIGYLIVAKKMRMGINISLIALSSTVAMSGLKQYFRRLRPEFPLIPSLKTFSFPSGHALSSFVFFGILVYLVWNSGIRPAFKWILSSLFLLFSLFIGISRIILKVHYPTDVIAGFCMGIWWVLIAVWLLNRIAKNQDLQL